MSKSSQFRVGQRVRVVKSAEWNPEIIPGMTGVIEEIDPKPDDVSMEDWGGVYRVLIDPPFVYDFPLWVEEVEAI